MHRTKTFLLMFSLIIVFMFFGAMIAGEDGIVMAFIFALVINFISYWNSDKLAIKMTKSKPLGEDQAPKIYKIVRKLTKNAKMPMPKIYLTPSNQPNAFA